MKNIFLIKNNDIFFWSSITILIIGVFLVGFFVVIKNITAKDVVFSYTALVAAMVMFVLNVVFSLQAKSEEKIFPINITQREGCIDILQYGISKMSFVVFSRDMVSHDLEIPDTKEVFHCNDFNARNKLLEKINEVVRIYIVGGLLSDYPDWQKKDQNYLFHTYSSFNLKKEMAGKNSFYTTHELIEGLQLKTTESVLSGHSLSEGLTLPPSTKVTTNGDDIIFDNNHINITISIDIDHNPASANTGSIVNGQLVFHECKNPWDYLRYGGNIKISMTFKKQRSGSPYKNEYLRWAEQLSNYLEQSLAYSPTQKL